MKTPLWKRYAPEGADWDPPHRKMGDLERETTRDVQEALLARATRLYWTRRNARQPELTETPAV